MHRRIALAIVAPLLAATACGLQPAAEDSLQASLTGAAPGALAGDPGLTLGELPGTTDGTTGTITGGTTTTGGTTGITTGGTSGTTTGGAAPKAQADTTVGVTATEIRIGIHAPITGASPLPQDSFETGKELYWKNGAHRVFGRKIVMEVLDDTYKPSGAIKVCEEMARRDFIILGGGGTDQIQACGRDQVLRRLGVPYISAGVTENGLQGIPTYYALSLTYPQQAPLVIRNARNQSFPMTKWAVVISDTPNFKDAQDAMTAELKKNGVEFKVILVPKSGGTSEAAAVSNDLRAYNAPVVFFLGQPTFFANVVTGSAQQLYLPIWTGVGVSMGLNTVAEVACAGTAGRYDGRFLSPFPGLDKAPKEFFAAGGKDDIELTLWGTSELMYNMMLGTKGNLTRQGLLASLPGKVYTSSTFPGVDFRRGHFAGTAAWSLKSNCNTQVYDTVGNAPLAI